METIEKTRESVLADFLGCDLDDVVESSYDDCLFEAEGAEYLVLDDDESDQRAYNYIRESVWAFNADFLSAYIKNGALSPEQIDALRGDHCESANDAMLALLDDFDDFASDAISADGRGHFMNTYDGEEHEQDGYYIYRTN